MGLSFLPLKKALITSWSCLPTHPSQEPPSCLWMVLESRAEGRSLTPLLRDPEKCPRLILLGGGRDTRAHTRCRSVAFPIPPAHGILKTTP